jgi:regulator of RNase E activity RraB
MINSSAEKDWDFYLCNVNGVLSSIMVNLGANRHAPMADKAWLLWVRVQMQSPRTDGLSSDTEAPKLYEIEDALTGAFSESGAELLGRITGGDHREFYFYSHNSGGLDVALDRIRHAFPGYLFECGTRHDPDWRQYRDVLYPSEVEMQRIQNRRLVDVLEKRGDDHCIPRPIDHAIYFRSPADRLHFAAAAVDAGFTVHSESDHDTKGTERRYFLNLVRTDPATLEHINEVVLQLLELVRRYDADYDGWGCEVQTAAPLSS